MNNIYIVYNILLLFSCIIFFTNKSVKSEKILSVAFMSSKSHKIVYEPLLLELAKRGHIVTIVTPIRSTTKIVKNIKEIVTMEHTGSFMDIPNLFEMRERNEKLNSFTMVDIFSKTCRDTYDMPEIKNLLNETFDLIILQPFFNDCVMGLVHHFKTSIILVSPISAPPIYTWITGTSSLPSVIPHFFTSYTDKMTYYERMINFGYNIWMGIILDFYLKPKMEQIYREKLGDPNIPSVNEIFHNNVSFILSNAHFSLTSPKPFLPNVVDVGGMHCRPVQKLPKELEQFINNSGNDGFIYFSMGTAIKGHTMPEKYRKVFVNVFSKLKQNILWKWETEEMPDLPKNVKLGKWLPQQDLLGHPKIKMFITHGGYGSTTEAVYHGTPLLGIPMFADQMLNMKKSENSGFALTVEFNELSEETLLAGINRILNDPSFHENAKSLSKVFRDQPDKPLDRAVFWTEYVLRHKGAIHMRSAARDLNFFQYHSIDVIISYVTIFFGIIYIIYALGKFLFKRFCPSSMTSTLKKSQKRLNKKVN